MKSPQEQAEEYAKKMIQDRGNPHWHDLRDCYLAGLEAGVKASAEVARNYTDITPTTWGIADKILALIEKKEVGE